MRITVQKSAWLFTKVKAFAKEEDGPTIAEYGLLLAFIALVVATAAAFLGQQIGETFGQAASSLSP